VEALFALLTGAGEGFADEPVEGEAYTEDWYVDEPFGEDLYEGELLEEEPPLGESFGTSSRPTA
jgi:hypothetical protein